MTIFQAAGALLSLIVVFGMLNQRFLKLPETIGITTVGLLTSIVLFVFSYGNHAYVALAQETVRRIDFADVVFHGLLSFLLFASALHVDLGKMRAVKLPVFLLSTVGVLISTAAVGVGFHLITLSLGHPVGWLWSLVFGALISPTDPIAVMSVLKNAGAEESLKGKIAGESLFNDGTGVVAFIAFLGLASGATEFSPSNIAITLAREVGGALVGGLLLGFGAHRMLRVLEGPALQVMVTLAVATAGYSVCELLHVSGPLAMVVAGLIVGNQGTTRELSLASKEQIFGFWNLLDELLNLVLFGLIGLEVIALSFRVDMIWVGIAAVPVVLASRALSVAIPLLALRNLHRTSPHSIKIMTWGGLRGGISVALALSLPEFHGREMLIGVTYLVVLFSLLVQATTLGKVIRHLTPCAPPPGTLATIEHEERSAAS
ncbi:cation:proton antiporter [Paraburkholderia guartelaensis]|uniref:cation:proton antiporter n=1 Tax=Paraburkholderia guartelaensis TaxID=2546446 RepID=UPI002AB649AF|nr:sodium:proton antiporter [Paraburkholderia guartelaensis]